jgi:hypothetical protein
MRRLRIKAGPVPTRYVARKRGLSWCVIDTQRPAPAVVSVEAHRFAAEQEARRLNNGVAAAARLASDALAAQTDAERWNRVKARKGLIV